MYFNNFRKDPLKDTTFSTFVAIPAGEEAFFWLTYEQQLSRSYGKYKYKTNIRPYEPVDLVQVKVNILESRNIKKQKTTVNFGDSQIARNGIKTKQFISFSGFFRSCEIHTNNFMNVSVVEGS